MDGGVEFGGDVGRPAVEGGEHSVADRAGAPVVLARDGGEEASAVPFGLGHVVDPLGERAGEALQSRRCADRPRGDPKTEPVDRGLQGGELQGLLRPEVADHPGLAHLQFGGQAADGQALQPLGGGQCQGALDDSGTGSSRFGDGLARAHGSSLTYRSFAKYLRTFVL